MLDLTVKRSTLKGMASMNTAATKVEIPAVAFSERRAFTEHAADVLRAMQDSYLAAIERALAEDRSPVACKACTAAATMLRDATDNHF
jgi:hypothetical protein